MIKMRNFGLLISLLAILLAFMAFQPMAVLADQAGFTETPTEVTEPPTATATMMVVTATATTVVVTPTPTLTPEIPAPVPSPTSPQPGQPTPEKQKKATAVPLLPVTGEIPPDGPSGGPLTWVILLAGILIGLALGLGGRKLLVSHSAGKSAGRFLSSRR